MLKFTGKLTIRRNSFLTFFNKSPSYKNKSKFQNLITDTNFLTLVGTNKGHSKPEVRPIIIWHKYRN